MSSNNDIAARKAAAQRARATRRVIAFTLSLGAATAMLAAFAVRGLAPVASPFHLPWWTLAMGFAGSEIFVVHLQLKRETHSISLSELPLLLGLFFVHPLAFIAGRTLGGSAALVGHRRQRGIKLAFNVVHFTLEATVAVLVFHLASPSLSHMGPTAWLSAAAAVVAVDCIGALTVTAVISLFEGSLQHAMLRRVLVSGGVAALINTGVGLLAVTTLYFQPTAIWLVGAMGVTLYLGYRGYASLSHRYVNLQQLYDFTRVVGRSPTVEEPMRHMLGQIRDLLRVEIAEITVMSSCDDGKVISTTLVDNVVESVVEDANPDPLGTWRRILSEDHPILCPRNSRDHGHRRILASQNARDLMVVPLHDNFSVVGMMTVANRMGDVSTFERDDLRLFETLANHVSTSLENGRLIERLRAEAAEKEYQAHHDSLTGLANRTLFHQRVHEGIVRARATGRKIAVMLMDLDRFKEINDTLGHHNGDVLLEEVGARLIATLGQDATIARLGGDEFALLLCDMTGPQDAVDAGRKLLEALEEPFALDELSLDISASIGIAVFPDHGEEAATLLQRADVSMYTAKTGGKGIDVYAPERDQYSPRRLALVGDLRRAIDAHELVLHYQPKVELATGDVVGAEALVRWQHPQFGFLHPDEFVTLAEQTGLVRALTLYVIEGAVRQCREWNEEGVTIGVAVNISARNLLDASLPDDIARILREEGLPAKLLTLEITETSIMGDVTRTIGVLDRLSAMGVRLSVDDFGTGYSSLSYLKRLPVDEVKIDKSFVLTMRSDSSDAAIVSSIVDLGANLGLSVVAEGIEDEDTMRELSSLGCAIGQGYHISRPVSPAHLRRWLARRPSAPATPHQAPRLVAVEA